MVNLIFPTNNVADPRSAAPSGGTRTGTRRDLLRDCYGGLSPQLLVSGDGAGIEIRLIFDGGGGGRPVRYGRQF